MRARIAALLVATAGIAVGVAAPASATPAPAQQDGISCTTVLDQPCVWQQQSGAGIVGVARVSGADPARLTSVRVEVRVQEAWGRPWQTVASATTVRTGTALATTPRVTTDLLTMVCATGGPAFDAAAQTTVCTHPF